MAIINRGQILRLRFRPVTAGSEAEALTLAARQNPVVTQTITRPYATITALVTLGPGDRTTTAPQITSPASTTTSSPTPSSATVAVPGSPNASSSSLTHEQLGAIIGSVLGSIVLIILIWYCVAARRRRNETHRVRYILSEESETSSDTAEVRMSGAGSRRVAGDPWVRRDAGISVVPPPPRFPPTPRYTPYRQTRYPQIRGVKRYP